LDAGTKNIDRLCTSLSQELLADMMEQSVAMCFGAHLMFCTKNLERIGDHTTNIAEAVHYMVKGETPLRERPKGRFRQYAHWGDGADIQSPAPANAASPERINSALMDGMKSPSNGRRFR